MQAAAELVHKKVAIWLSWWSITEKFLRLSLRRRLWGLIGKHLQTIAGRGDLRATRLRKSWADTGTELCYRYLQWQIRVKTTLQQGGRKHKNPATVPSIHDFPLPRLVDHMAAEDGPSDAEEEEKWSVIDQRLLLPDLHQAHYLMSMIWWWELFQWSPKNW